MDRIQFRGDTKANWEAVNPLLLPREIGFVLDSPGLYKIGDGEHYWSKLPYRGFDGDITQESGDSITKVMSQEAVTRFVNDTTSKEVAKGVAGEVIERENYYGNDIVIGTNDINTDKGAFKIDLIESEWQIVFPDSSINFYRTRGNDVDRILGKNNQFLGKPEKERTFKFNSTFQLILNTDTWLFSTVDYNYTLAKNEIYAFGGREYAKSICPWGILVPTLFYSKIQELTKALTSLGGRVAKLEGSK